jgi:predicted RNase H-like HicB family nuclease
MNKVFSVIVTEEDGLFTAVNPDTDVASQGKTIDEALANIHEALELYLEEVSTTGAEALQPHATLLTTVTV